MVTTLSPHTPESLSSAGGGNQKGEGKGNCGLPQMEQESDTAGKTAVWKFLQGCLGVGGGEQT